MSYHLLKYLHILSAIGMFGGTICNGLMKIYFDGQWERHRTIGKKAVPIGGVATLLSLGVIWIMVVKQVPSVSVYPF